MNGFLSCDWGNSSFRLRLVETGTKKIYSEVLSDEGISEKHRQWVQADRPEWERIDFYRSTLAESISRLTVHPDKKMPLICSGMASSSIGLKELPYQAFPFTWDPASWVVEKITEDEKFSHPLYLVSGFKTGSDIMRGEETILLGCDIPDNGEKIFIFPGTHSKHVFVKNKKGIDFKTYMTGELFTLMSEKSILRHALQRGADEVAFEKGIHAGRDGNILHELFGVRAGQLLRGADAVSNYQWLSGLLIGAELKDLLGMDGEVYLVCGEHLKHPYLTGLEFMAIKGRINYLNAEDMLINGHCKMASHFL